MQDRKEVLQFNMGREVVLAQTTGDPGAKFILLPDPTELTFAVCRRRAGALSEPVKGLVFDTFHLGMGQLVRDALNRAYEMGVAAGVGRG